MSSFSLYAARESGYHHLHPMTKLAISAVAMIAGLLLGGVWPGYTIFALVLIPLAMWGRVLRSLVGSSSLTVLPFAISLLLIRGFIWPGGTVLLAIGPLVLKAEGLAFALEASGRILAMIGSFVLLSLTTRADALMLALTERGFPPMIAYIVVTTIQIVPRFQARASAILDAQRARGLETEGGFLKRAAALLPLVVPLVLSSLVDMEERAIALEGRAFNRPGPRTSLMLLHDTPAQAMIRWLLLALILALFIGRGLYEFAR
jgi:energy-coupling factor transport system permease protein